jgi:hypothetical protein
VLRNRCQRRQLRSRCLIPAGLTPSLARGRRIRGVTSHEIAAHADRGGEEGASAQPTPLTRRSGTRTDSVHGHLGPGCRAPSGGRWQRRVGARRGRPGRASGQTGPTVTSGWSRETETCWSVRRGEETRHRGS